MTLENAQVYHKQVIIIGTRRHQFYRFQDDIINYISCSLRLWHLWYRFSSDKTDIATEEIISLASEWQNVTKQRFY
jgi:hypothetical protein